MLYSGFRRLRRQLPLCFVALILCGCGNGEHSVAGTSAPTTFPTQDNDNSVQQSTLVAVTAATNQGGYVVDDNTSLFCDSANEFCDTQVENGSIESLTAVPRYGYRFNQWQYAGSAQNTTSSSLSLIAEADVSVTASFQKQENISQPDCHASMPPTRFRSLHLGDSLTATQCWKTNCNPYNAADTQESEREAIRFYETSMAANADDPRTVAVPSERINGTNRLVSEDGSQPLGFEADNFWKWSLARHQEAPEDFDVVVVALGTNDIADISSQVTDIDSIVESRIKPFLQWVGNKPIFWMLPHYAFWYFQQGEMNLYARTDGIACSCGSNAPATTECKLSHALEQCNATAAETQNTVAAFKAIHQFRTRMLELQSQYPNLHVIDAEQLIAQQSNGLYDQYQQLRGDKLHFNSQGAEWYAWAHAYLAQSMNAACAQSLPRWEMSTAENDMIAELQ